MCKNKVKEDYIHVHGKYYFTNDALGYTIVKEEVVKKVMTGKPDTRGNINYYTVGYTGTIGGVINIVMKELVHDKVATSTLRDLKGVKEYFDSELKEITNKFEI